MGLFTKDIQTMDDLFLHGLQDIYYAENQIVKSLPKMIEKATNRDLTKGLKDHLEETEKQVARLDQVFKLLGQEPKGVKCPAIDGLISEADEGAGEVRRQDRPGRRHRRLGPGGGTLRDCALRHPDRLGGRPGAGRRPPPSTTQSQRIQ